MEKSLTFTMPLDAIDFVTVQKLFEETVAKPFNAQFVKAYDWGNGASFEIEMQEGDEQGVFAQANLSRFADQSNFHVVVDFLIDGTAVWNENGKSRPIESWTVALKECLDFIAAEVTQYSQKIRAELAHAATLVTSIQC